MSLVIPKPYLNLTDIKRCKFCWYFKEASHITSHGGCRLHETMVRNDYLCASWLEPTGELKVDAKGFEAPRNKIIR